MWLLGRQVPVEEGVEPRPGAVILVRKRPCLVLSAGAGGGEGQDDRLRVQLRVLGSGRLIVRHYRPGERRREARLQVRRCVYRFFDGKRYLFMDNDNLEQFSLRCAGPDDRGLWLKEGEGYDLLFWRGRPLDLALPAQMVFVVAECWTSPRAETILGADKPATMETGLSLRVPLSVMPGDRILVDTATKSYHGRYDGA